MALIIKTSCTIHYLFRCLYSNCIVLLYQQALVYKLLLNNTILFTRPEPTVAKYLRDLGATEVIIEDFLASHQMKELIKVHLIILM